MKANKKTRILSNLMLVIAAAIWGSNFVFQKIVATDIGPFTFMGARTFLGVLTLIPIIIWFDKKKSDEGKTFTSLLKEEYYSKSKIIDLVKTAAYCGLINVSGSVLVQFGLIYTTASKAGFLNSIYIIFVPILGLLIFNKKTSKFMWSGIILAVFGLYNLCINESLIINLGDGIVLSSTLCFAMHIQLLSKYVLKFKGMHFAFVEFCFATFYCTILAFIFEEPTLSQLAHCSISLVFSGILGIGVCYALQVTAQKYTDPSVAALLMSLESVFAAIAGVIFLNERFTSKELFGVVLIIIAVIIAQLPSKETPKQDQNATQTAS